MLNYYPKVNFFEFTEQFSLKNVFKITKETYTTGFYDSGKIKIYGMTNANFFKNNLYDLNLNLTFRSIATVICFDQRLKSHLLL